MSEAEIPQCEDKKKKSNSSFLRLIGNFFRTLFRVLKFSFMTLGFFVFLSTILISFSTYHGLKKATPKLPDEMFLLLTLEDQIVESRSPDLFHDPFSMGDMTLHEMVNALERGKTDERVKGLILQLKQGAYAPAHIEELRAALLSFKESGKPMKIYGTSYGGFGSGLGIYYLASLFDEIWMQPVGVLSVAGFNFEMPFFRKTLDKTGVTPDFLKRAEYKTAVENLTNEEISDENRETLESILGDFSARMIQTITSERNMSTEKLISLIDQGIFTGEEALAAGLIDHLNYGDVLLQNMRKTYLKTEEETYHKKPELVALAQYAQRSNAIENLMAMAEDQKVEGKTQIALIRMSGAIMQSAEETSSAQVIAADKMAEILHQAGRDESVKAIVIRIDSPGGDPVASETIRRAIFKAKENGKPVILSMGSAAASGGYWIAAEADYIFALPSTLTGSIGVIMGKFLIKDLSEKLGINWEQIKSSENADLWSPLQAFDEKDMERMNVLIDNIYDKFLKIVSEGREIPLTEVEKIAKGRAWTGAQALEIGLVDELGTLNDTLDYTAQKLNLASRDDLEITVFPKPSSLIERALRRLLQQSYVFENIGQYMEVMDPYIEQISAAKKVEGLSAYDNRIERFEN